MAKRGRPAGGNSSPFDLAGVLAQIRGLLKPTKKEITRLEREREKIDRKIKGYRETVQWLDMRAGTAKASVKAGKKKGRTRRNAEQLAADATKIAEFVAGAGDKGRSAKDIRDKYGLSEQENIVAFVKKHGGGTMKKVGERGRGVKYVKG